MAIQVLSQLSRIIPQMRGTCQNFFFLVIFLNQATRGREACENWIRLLEKGPTSVPVLVGSDGLAGILVAVHMR